MTDLVLRGATSTSDPAFWGKTHRKTQISRNHEVRKKGAGIVIRLYFYVNLLTFVVSDEAGPVAKVLVTFNNLLIAIIVTLKK